MTDRAKIITIYTVVTILSVGVIATSLYIRNIRVNAYGSAEDFADIDKQDAKAEDWGELEADLELVNQDGEAVKMSDLKDKVWVAHNFFASCPECALTSARDLKDLYKEFGENPDFHIVSISINPADQVEELKKYADKLEAESSNWWFLGGSEEVVHRYVEKEMKFMRVRRTPNGDRAFSHDLGLQVYAKDWKRVKKKDLHYAASESTTVYEASFQEIRDTIKEALRRPILESAPDPKGEPSAKKTEETAAENEPGESSPDSPKSPITP